MTEPDTTLDLDLTTLVATPTRLRATAAALAMVLHGQRPSVSEVARLSGVSRQALTKDHKPVTEFIAGLRASWEPPTTSPVGKLQAELASTRAKLRRERELRTSAERDRDRALHHLQLAEASLDAIRNEDSNVARPQFGRPRAGQP